MRKITKKEAKIKGLKVQKLLAWIELEKQIELMKLEAKILRDDSFVDAFMSLQNDTDIIIGNEIKLKNVISTRFNSTQFKSENPRLYEKYKNLTVNSIRKEKI
jgi:predicted phage-related endonuclease